MLSRRFLPLLLSLALALLDCAGPGPAYPEGERVPRGATEPGAERVESHTEAMAWSCPNLDAYCWGYNDAGPAIAACINGAPDGAVISLPNCVFAIANSIHITRTGMSYLRVTTRGAESSTQSCFRYNSNQLSGTPCATLKAQYLDPTRPILIVDPNPRAPWLTPGELPGTAACPSAPANPFARVGNACAQNLVLDHLIIDGNKLGIDAGPGRPALAPGAALNAISGNIYFHCKNCQFLYSASINAPAGTGMQPDVPYDSDVSYIDWNHFLWNGCRVGTQGCRHADGLSVWGGSHTEFGANTFFDNTDVDFVLFNAPWARVHDNVVHQTFAPAGAGIALGTNGFGGNFTGLRLGVDGGNLIDGGNAAYHARLDYGVILNTDGPWYGPLPNGDGTYKTDWSWSPDQIPRCSYVPSAQKLQIGGNAIVNNVLAPVLANGVSHVAWVAPDYFANTTLGPQGFGCRSDDPYPCPWQRWRANAMLGCYGPGCTYSSVCDLEAGSEHFGLWAAFDYAGAPDAL
jgi:hypothetical protein